MLSRIEFEGFGLRQTLAACGVALLLFGLGVALPHTAVYDVQGPGPAILHLLLELLSAVLAGLVVTISWHALSRTDNATAKLLVFGFTVVAGMDLLHAVHHTLLEQPGLAEPSAMVDPYWLLGRAAALLTIIGVVSGFRAPGHRGAYAASAVVVLALTYGITGGPAHLSGPGLPEPGAGQAGWQVFRWLLGGGNLWVAAWLLVYSLRRKEQRWLWLATACFLAGLGETAPMADGHHEDLAGLAGHLFKITAYAMILRAVFHAGVVQPYARLAASERLIRRQDSELSGILRNVPVELARMDARLHYRYVNPAYAARLARDASAIVGQPWPRLRPADWPPLLDHRIEGALTGQRVEFEFSYADITGQVREMTMVAVPDRDEHGHIEGVLALFTDRTEREQVRRQLAESARDLSELRAALDAHAIVAVTDAQGVILRVNDKFCTISKFPRSELLGNTHRIINSGHHPKAFFQDLWATISSGRVWNGEICNRAKDGSLYWVYTTIVPFIGEEGIPVQYIAIRADITERKRAEQDAQRMAFFDALTGLPNRRLMVDRLRQAIQSAGRTGRHGALLLLDLDNFKEINDTLGHDQGDELLRQVGQRLAHCVRQSDTVARMGGDEFVAIIGGLGESGMEATLQADGIADKIREALTRPYLCNGLRVDCTASVGLVMFHEANEAEDELFKRADMALYRAKALGRNRISQFDPALQADVVAHASLLADLRQALPRDELRLHYQPVVDAQRQLLGYEALVRWEHPTRGLVPPNSFIPLAEQTGLIQAIGQWVTEQACRQLAQWRSDPVRARLTVAVNVSARQVREQDFAEKIQAAILSSGADPHRLRVELTESMFHADLEETVRKMETLQAVGVGFSLDDFGTGYSSLSYLKRLPLDTLKIDRSFVKGITDDPNDAAIARTIIALAATLGLHTVAEGVETEAQFQFLQDLGCEAFQGYHLGRPGPLNPEA